MTGTPEPQRRGVIAPVAAVAVLTVAVAWMMLLLVDPGEHDGIMGNLVMFVLVPLAAAVVVQVLSGASWNVPGTRGPVLWWAVVALPGGVVAGFAVDAIRDPEYYLGDGWFAAALLAVFVWAMLALGLVVWFFLFWPVAAVIAVLRLRRSGTDDERRVLGASAVILPVVVFVAGVGAVVAGLSVDPGGARLGIVTAVFSLVGIPGNYEITWEPGLWIVRGIVVFILVITLVPRLVRRSRGEPHPAVAPPDPRADGGEQPAPRRSSRT